MGTHDCEIHWTNQFWRKLLTTLKVFCIIGARGRGRNSFHRRVSMEFWKKAVSPENDKLERNDDAFRSCDFNRFRFVDIYVLSENILRLVIIALNINDFTSITVSSLCVNSPCRKMLFPCRVLRRLCVDGFMENLTCLKAFKTVLHAAKICRTDFRPLPFFIVIIIIINGPL